MQNPKKTTDISTNNSTQINVRNVTILGIFLETLVHHLTLIRTPYAPHYFCVELAMLGGLGVKLQRLCLSSLPNVALDARHSC
jgi:hypothetical protein